jgi:hypothetical protein
MWDILVERHGRSGGFQRELGPFSKNYVSRTVGVLGGGRPDRPLFLPVVGL